MKCVCGYEYVVDLTRAGRIIVKGDDRFVRVDGTFTIECDSNEGGTHLEKVVLHACPKCGTVRMDQ